VQCAGESALLIGMAVAIATSCSCRMVHGLCRFSAAHHGRAAWSSSCVRAQKEMAALAEHYSEDETVIFAQVPTLPGTRYSACVPLSPLEHRAQDLVQSR
jgi:hypothetical protein